MGTGSSRRADELTVARWRGQLLCTSAHGESSAPTSDEDPVQDLGFAQEEARRAWLRGSPGSFLVPSSAVPQDGATSQRAQCRAEALLSGSAIPSLSSSGLNTQAPVLSLGRPP